MRIDWASGQVKLTGRERKLVSLIGQDLPYKLIAEEMKISELTVRHYAYRLFSQLQVNGKPGLFRWAMSHPAALRGEWVKPAMHKAGCPCKEPYCQAMRALQEVA